MQQVLSQSGRRLIRHFDAVLQHGHWKLKTNTTAKRSSFTLLTSARRHLHTENGRDKSVVVLAGAALIAYAGLGDISSERGWIITGKHVSNTRTVRWEICYVHPQSDRRLYLDTPSLF